MNQRLILAGLLLSLAAGHAAAGASSSASTGASSVATSVATGDGRVEKINKYALKSAVLVREMLVRQKALAADPAAGSGQAAKS